MYVHLVCLFAPWTQGVNWACNKTFRSRPECFRNVLCMFRIRAVSRAGTYMYNLGHNILELYNVLVQIRKPQVK